MNQRSIFDQPTAPPLRVVLADLAAGRLQIPMFQRSFEWRDDQRLGLFDSLARGIPIGSVIVWHTHTHKVACFPMLDGFKLKAPTDGGVRRYLIDGHQRLYTLFGALNYEGERTGQRTGTIYFDARAPADERPFILHRSAQPPPAHWISLSALMHPRLRWEHVDRLRNEGDTYAGSKIAELALILSDYPLPMIPLLSEDLDLVAESFVRINSSGTPLREHHLLNALGLLTFKIDERIPALLAALAELGWGELEEQLILDALKLSLELDVYRAAPSEFVAQSHARHGEARLAARFDELEAAFVSAVKLLNRHFIAGPHALLHPYQLITIVEAYRRPRGVQDERAVIAWLWWTTYHNTFEGMTHSELQEAVEHLCAIAAAQRTAPTLNVDLNISTQESLSRRHALKLLLVQGDNAQARALGSLGDGSIYLAHPTLYTSKAPSFFDRVVCPEDDLIALHDAIEEPAANEDLLEQHMIPIEAARALMEGDAATFEALRRDYMLAQERVFVTALGLVPSDQG